MIAKRLSGCTNIAIISIPQYPSTYRFIHSSDSALSYYTHQYTMFLGITDKNLHCRLEVWICSFNLSNIPWRITLFKPYPSFESSLNPPPTYLSSNMRKTFYLRSSTSTSTSTSSSTSTTENQNMLLQSVVYNSSIPQIGMPYSLFTSRKVLSSTTSTRITLPDMYLSPHMFNSEEINEENSTWWCKSKAFVNHNYFAVSNSLYFFGSWVHWSITSSAWDPESSLTFNQWHW